MQTYANICKYMHERAPAVLTRQLLISYVPTRIFFHAFKCSPTGCGRK